MRRFYNLIAKMLIVTMIWIPFTVQAGMIGTDQVITSAQDQQNRDKVLNFVSRTDVAQQFESFGISAASAKDRVNAMTQEELTKVAGQIDSLPAGASDGWVWVAVVVVVGLIIRLVWYKK